MIEHIRDPECTRCRHHAGVDEVCVLGRSFGQQMEPDNPDAHKNPWMVVTSRPNSPNFQHALSLDLKEAGINTALVYFTWAMKCNNYEINIGKKDLKACSEFLEQEIFHVAPTHILTMGNEALQAVAGRSGVMKYRGRVLKARGLTVIPTVSPSAVLRNPGQRGSYMADLRLFAAETSGIKTTVKPPKYAVIDSVEKLKKLERALDRSELLSFDIETTGDSEFHDGAAIVSLAGTSVIDGKLFGWALPLYHPESPFRRVWKRVLARLGPRLRDVPRRIAHNGKYDCRWLRRFGVPDIDLTFDGMLAAHLLDENREKGLKPQAMSRLGIPPWAIETKDLLNTPLDKVLEYNFLDTYYEYRIYLLMREELKTQPRLFRIFKLITLPAANRLIGVEQRGIWVDRERLSTNTKIAADMLSEISDKLMTWVPEPDNAWPTNTKDKVVDVNFNPSNFARWWLFEHLQLPIIERGKPKDDGRPGDPSMREAVMLELRPLHPVVPILLERVKWQKYSSSFLSTYAKLLDDNDRIHTTFKLAGTVTGRLSSGKADADKVTAARKIRGVNIQQVPRDPFIRGMFGAAPGYSFVEADFSQIELRIVAMLSGEPTMCRLYQRGADIHLYTASRTLGIPESRVTKEDRKKAKAINFGFVYGMGWRKFIATAYEKYDLSFSEAEAKAIRATFFEEFRGLLPWHARQRRLVNANARVQNPIGRIRHLPDIESPDEGVRAEAERQAINSPVQSFGSDLCMLSFISLHDRFLRDDLDAHTIGTVHDSLLFEVRTELLPEVLPIIKNTMENLPLRRLFGLSMPVPIIVDLKVGSHWGDARELSEEEVYSYAR